MKNVIFFIGMTIVLNCGFACTGTNKETTQKAEKKMEGNKEYSKEAMELLSRLNYWVENGGDHDHPVDSIKPQGEASAMVENLKKKIADAGYKIEWDGKKYVFIE